MTNADGIVDLTPVVLENIERARARRPRHDRRRRHAELLARPVRRGRAARRDPQDDGQRRRGDRVLHRLLDRDHPGEGADQPPADDARLARADRRLPDLRPGRRVLGALHGLRHLRALRHPGGAVRPRPARRGRRPPIARRTRRGYAVVVTAEGAIWKGAQMQDVGEADMFGHRHKANVGEALAAELKARTGIETVASELTYDLRSRRARCARRDGRDDLREHRDGPRPGRGHRPDDGDPGRQVRPHRAARGRHEGPPGRSSPTCTTRSASGRATRASSATRCCSSASAAGWPPPV